MGQIAMEYSEQNLEMLRNRLSQQDVKIRLDSVTALAEFAAIEKVVDDLIAILDNKAEKWFIRIQAIKSLNKSKSRKAIGAIFAVVNDEEAIVGSEARLAIGNLAANNEPLLIEALLEALGNDKNRFWAADTLGYYSKANLVQQALMDKVNKGNANEREAAAFALGYFKGEP